MMMWPCYPSRPGQEPCKHYLRVGTCKFGPNCKFDHLASVVPTPLNSKGCPMRQGVLDCAFYLRTSGECKFGVSCKFNHPELLLLPPSPPPLPPVLPSPVAVTVPAVHVASPYNVQHVYFCGANPYHYQYQHQYPAVPPLAGAAMTAAAAYPAVPVEIAYSKLVADVQRKYMTATGEPACYHYILGKCVFKRSCKSYHPPELKVPERLPEAETNQAEA